MTLDDVFALLSSRGVGLSVDDGELHYHGPKLPPDDPLRVGIAEHRAMLIELFTYAPGGRCVFTDCYHLLGEGDRIACAEHRAELDARELSVGGGVA
jgi:hypothetical protein